MFQRYANPLELINRMLLMGRFREFVDEFIATHNEEQEDKTLWEFYLEDGAAGEYTRGNAGAVVQDSATASDMVLLKS